MLLFFFTFCYLKVSFSTSCLMDRFTGYRILGWKYSIHVVSFSTLKIFYCLLSLVISFLEGWGEVNCHLIIAPLNVICLFSLATCKILSAFVFCIFTMMWLSIDSFSSSFRGRVLGFLEPENYVFSEFWKTLNHWGKLFKMIWTNYCIFHTWKQKDKYS